MRCPMPEPDTIDLTETCLDLADGGAVHTHAVDEHFWPRLMAGEIALDRLMAVFEIAEDMRHWEMHPAGEEVVRSEEHTSELQSLMRISYAVFCLKKKNNINSITSSSLTTT